MMDAFKNGSDMVFVLLGAIMVLAMHAGFAFLEVGTVRKKNQVNALVKIISDFAVSTIAYFFIGYAVAYGTGFFDSAEVLSVNNGYELVKFFFLLTFAGNNKKISNDRPSPLNGQRVTAYCLPVGTHAYNSLLVCAMVARQG